MMPPVLVVDDDMLNAEAAMASAGLEPPKR